MMSWRYRGASHSPHSYYSTLVRPTTEPTDGHCFEARHMWVWHASFKRLFGWVSGSLEIFLNSLLGTLWSAFTDHWTGPDLLRWERFVEKVGFKSGVNEWRSNGYWEWWWWQRWFDEWMRRWTSSTDQPHCSKSRGGTLVVQRTIDFLCRLDFLYKSYTTSNIIS